MAKAELKRLEIKVVTEVQLTLTESEARALDAIFGYDVERFLAVFYEKMGRAYVQPHEDGVRSLHKTMRGCLADPISRIDKLRKGL